MYKCALFFAVAAMGLTSCGGSTVKPEWTAEVAWSRPVNGLSLFLESGRDTYLPRKPIYFKVGLMNTMLKARYLDVSNSYASLSFEVTGPEGDVEPGPGNETLTKQGDFIRMESDDSIKLSITGPETANWSYDLSAPGRYTVKAVYEAEISDAWNRQAVAGGRFEDQVLFTDTVKSEPVSFEVQAPKKR